MFTPPPSPQPHRLVITPPSPQPIERLSLMADSTPPEHYTVHEEKKATGRRFRFMVLLVPVVLIAITLTARLLTAEEHSSYDFSSLSDSLWQHSLSGGELRLQHSSLHKRNPDPQAPGIAIDSSAASSGTSGRPTGTASNPSASSQANQVTPTVPDTPPVLPTPFVQPFDGSLPQNFSSPTCLNFFTNMTNSRPFRSCRPFSLLLQTSDEFISAQQNLTFLNDLVWGTCNTNTDQNECIGNMQWFANELRSQCTAELRDGNSLALNTLLAIEAYAPMREAACQIDPTTNTYCFVNAARDTNPANLYYYSLPLGIKLPKSTDPQCNACLKSLMGMYSSVLKSSTSSEEVRSLPGLVQTYENAAELTLGKCGVGFALTGIAGSALGGRLGVDSVWALGVLSLVAAALVHGVV
ncbi:hypothetical protein BKA70DRAFT_396591 [Coprinopsis sp. MPI-PUGE-AT-0042]|nr:hypothetical protein BKA70DRAFT_396591 [Coprinopsis sp. MPI-PUGE-AT-0042]